MKNSRILTSIFLLFQLPIFGQNVVSFDSPPKEVSVTYCDETIDELHLTDVPSQLTENDFTILGDQDQRLEIADIISKNGNTIFLKMDESNLGNLPIKSGDADIQYLKLQATNDFEITVEFEESEECKEEVIKYEFVNPYYDALELVLKKNDTTFSDFEFFLYATMKEYGSDSAIVQNSFLDGVFRDQVELTYIGTILKNGSLDKHQKKLLKERKMSLEKEQIEEFSFNIGFSDSNSNDNSGFISKSISTIRGLNVTTFADELSQFLIDRAKQELNIAFFQRLSKFFDKTPEIRVLFPKTADALENLLSYEYPVMIKTLRNVFHEDLQNVFFKTDDVFKLPKYESLIKEFPEIILSLKTIQIIAEIDDERHPSDIIGDFKAIPEWTDPKLEKHFSATLYNFRAALQTSHLFSESVRFNSFNDSPKKLKELGNFNGKSEVIVQLDSGLAKAIEEKDFYFQVDTIKRSSIEEFKQAVITTIRNKVDTTKISDITYLNPFLQNLTESKITPGTISASNIEELILKVNSHIEGDSSPYKKEGVDYLTKKMIRTYKPERAWITRQHINYLIQDTLAFKYFMAILFQQTHSHNVVTAKKTKLVRDDHNKHTLIRGSVIAKGSSIGAGSEINGKPATSSGLSEDKRIALLSTIHTGSGLKKGSILIESQPFTELLANKKDQLYLIRDYFQELIELTDHIDEIFTQIQVLKSKNEKVSDEKLHEYINKAIDVLEYAGDVSYFFQGNLKYEPYLKIARNGNDMYLNIVQKEYSSAINNLVTILEEVSNEVNLDLQSTTAPTSNVDSEIKDILNERDASIGGSFFGIRTGVDGELNKIYKERISNIKQKKFDIKSFRKFTNTSTKVLKYGTFMANIVSSDSVEEVQAAIKAAALPVGSYAIKRESKIDIAINAYLGVGLGQEIFDNGGLDNLKKEVSNNVIMEPDKNLPLIDEKRISYGIWSPVGIAASYGIGNKKSAGSVSLFFSLIDLGAIVDFRLKNPGSDSLKITTEPNTMLESDTIIVKRTVSLSQFPEITLDNILAPGAFLVYGIPKLPISIGAGFQKRPQLREINIHDDGELMSTIEVSSSFKWNAFIAVDIPLITLFNRPK